MTRRLLGSIPLLAMTLAACRAIDAPEAGATADEGDGSDESSGTEGGTTMPATASSPSTTDPDPDATTDDPSTTAGPSSTMADGSEDTGDQDDTSGTGDTTGDDGSTGTDDSTGEDTGPVQPMPCDQQCLSLPNDGVWTGPFRLEEGGSVNPAPECAGAWGIDAQTYYDGLVAPAANCDCECGDAENVTCDETLTLYRKANNGLSCVAAGVLDTYELSPGCNPINELDMNTRWDLAVESPEGGSCDAISEVDLPEVTFSTRYTLCAETAPAEGECVGDQQCTAESDAPLCVSAPGDLACPGNGFAVKHLVVPDDVVDTRGCSACTCGDPEGSCTTTGIDLYDFDNACMPELFNAPIDLGSSGCVTSQARVFDAYYPDSAIPVANTSCDPSPVFATGEVSTAEPVTLCCNG